MLHNDFWTHCLQPCTWPAEHQQPATRNYTPYAILAIWSWPPDDGHKRAQNMLSRLQVKKIIVYHLVGFLLPILWWYTYKHTSNPHYSWLYSEYGGELWLLDAKLQTEKRMVKFDYLRCFQVIRKNEVTKEMMILLTDLHMQVHTHTHTHTHSHTPKSRHTLWIFLSFLSYRTSEISRVLG